MEQPQDLQRSFNETAMNVKQALFDYVENNNIEKMKELVELFKDKKDAKFLKNYGLSLNAENKSSETLLHIACEKNNFEMAKLLIENGANVNDSPTYRRDAPLHYAVKYADLTLVKLLVEKGADVNVRTKYSYSARDAGDTALKIAVQYDKVDVVKFLVKNGADMELKFDTRDWTVLQYAARDGFTETAKVLIQEGANFRVEYNGDNTIEFALWHGKKETAAAMTDAINKKIAPISKKLKGMGY